MANKSFIVGCARVYFGGKIALSVGYDPDTKIAGVIMSELKEQNVPGERIKNPDNYGDQVQLVFDNLESINVLREALDIAERSIKDNNLPDEFGSFKKVETEG